MDFFIILVPVKILLTKKNKIMAFTHTNARGTLYNLNCKDVTLKSTGRVQRIYYFSKMQDLQHVTNQMDIM